MNPVRVVRVPYGKTNAAVLANLAADGYTYNVFWSLDPQGWRGKPADTITRLILQGVTPGAIVLMHSTDAGDAQALPTVIADLRAEGYSFATVAQMTGAPPASTPAPAPLPTPPAQQQVYFPETGHWLSHGFLNYWEIFRRPARLR